MWQHHLCVLGYILSYQLLIWGHLRSNSKSVPCTSTIQAVKRERQRRDKLDVQMVA